MGSLEEGHRRCSSFLGLPRQGCYLRWQRGADLCTERLISLLHPFRCPCSKSSSPQPLWHSGPGARALGEKAQACADRGPESPVPRLFSSSVSPGLQLSKNSPLQCRAETSGRSGP